MGGGAQIHIETSIRQFHFQTILILLEIECIINRSKSQQDVPYPSPHEPHSAVQGLSSRAFFSKLKGQENNMRKKKPNADLIQCRLWKQLEDGHESKDATYYSLQTMCRKHFLCRKQSSKACS